MQDISSKHSHADVQVSWLGSTQWGSFLLCSPLFKCKKEYKQKDRLLCSVVHYFFFDFVFELRTFEHVVERPRAEIFLRYPNMFNCMTITI